MKRICYNFIESACGKCPHGSPHEEHKACGNAKKICQCSPVPGYVRVTYGTSAYLWYHNRVGEVFKVYPKTTIGGSWIHVKLESEESKFIDPADCEPCEAPNETTTQDDYEELRQRIIRYGRFDPETPDRLFALLRQISVPHEITLDMARYIDGERKMVPIKKETPEKYKQVQEISIKILWDAQPDPSCNDFIHEWAQFMNFLSQDMWPTRWEIVWDLSTVEKLLSCLKAHEHGPAWLSFMERHGFIEKVFDPFDVVLRVKHEESVASLLVDKIRIPSGSFWGMDIRDQLKAHGFEP